MSLDSQFRKSFIYRVLFARGIKKHLEKIPFVRRIYAGWSRIHPFDQSYGTDTSGYVPVEGITGDQSLQKQINPYAASQPSIVRKALGSIPNPREYSLIDLGCGKGRVTIIGTEFTFKQVIGVELSPDLARVGQANAAKVKAKFPERTPVNVVEGNALQFPLPPGKVVMFLCHSFGRELVKDLIQSIERGLQSSSIEHFMFVYYNPVNGDLFDTSPSFSRWYAEVLPYAEEEVGFGPDLEDTVVIWQSVKGALPDPHPGAGRQIVILKEHWTAGLAR